MSKVFNDHHQGEDDSENNFFGLCIVSLIFGGEFFVNILFFTSILIVEFLFFETHGNHIFTTLTEICFVDFCTVGRALEQCGE